MGNTSSNPAPTTATTTSTKKESLAPTRSRPLKTKKRSIVDHPPLLTGGQPSHHPIPSNPIPIPIPIPIPSSSQYNGPPHNNHSPRPTTRNNDSADVVPDLLSQNQHTHIQRPLQYTSTSSFGVVRRAAGSSQDGGPSSSNARQNHSERSETSLGNVNDTAAENGQASSEEGEIVRSSIPLRLPQAVLAAANDGRLPTIAQEDDDDLNDEDGHETLFIPTTIVWKGGGNDVFLAGTFHPLEWRARERLYFDPSTSIHVATINIPPGTYRIKFIVDDAWRCSTDLPTAADDKTGNLVNYIDVEDPSALVGQGGDETQGRDGKVMKANLRRTYPRRDRNSNQTEKALTARSPASGRAYHPPLLPPSDSFWGEDTSRTSHIQTNSGGDDTNAPPIILSPFHSGPGGWEHGRDGVLEKWTDVIPEPLIAAAQQEEAYIQALNAAREARRGGAGTKGGGTVGSLGMGVPNIPLAPRLPRHLDKVLLNSKGGNTNTTSSGWAAVLPSLSGAGISNPPSSVTAVADVSRASSSRSRAHRSRTLGMTSLPDSTPSPGTPGKPVPDASAGLDHWVQVQADDSSVLPVPSHVILHHLGTSAIKNGVLAVSDTTRYNKKYVTTIYYKPT